MIIFEQKWHTGRKEFYRYSGKYVLPVFTGILVKKCATLIHIKLNHHSLTNLFGEIFDSLVLTAGRKAAVQ